MPLDLPVRRLATSVALALASTSACGVDPPDASATSPWASAGSSAGDSDTQDSTTTGDGDASSSTTGGAPGSDAVTGPVDSTTSGTGADVEPTTTAPSDPTTGGMSDEPTNCEALRVTYRDFMPMHPDFGCHMAGKGARPGLVMSALGADHKPVLDPNPPPPPKQWKGDEPQITSEQTFAEWYNTTGGVNLEIAGELALTEIEPGLWSFASSEFYPLTDQGFGNNVTPNWDGDTYPDRNGAFTTEIHTTFVYEPGQQFSFSGDDDVWIFIDGELALDLGGLHSSVKATIDLDDLGLAPGAVYSLDAFHAERCDSGSNFRIDTSIACFIPQ
ncbi:fibro-slime domain-containing protein [Nannocystis punicea]|uniref:Fibro-slime domain-containing protein n=1 Tax=Nannocystis punicea TaxID=2995304 RepID=A0ABY7GXM8_9BACT|nr:fibro-slime domain-containing protein [Nannocystis poenicansa]WAS91698.1 fibro-slime domain-containing protein [Nannocystis poenicansa]